MVADSHPARATFRVFIDSAQNWGYGIPPIPHFFFEKPRNGWGTECLSGQEHRQNTDSPRRTGLVYLIGLLLWTFGGSALPAKGFF
jgi:hypothetical protein